MDTFLSAKIQTDLKCFQCDTNSAVTSYSISNCDTNCFVLSSANDWLVFKIKYLLRIFILTLFLLSH